mmetsp:Transcript_4350/g.12360  ORF Transcript_4350/g.12360 Transcript_4350/m.12360 type:complete len:101 (+) Transcript_4350:135-437(+)
MLGRNSPNVLSELGKGEEASEFCEAYELTELSQEPMWTMLGQLPSELLSKVETVSVSPQLLVFLVVALRRVLPYFCDEIMWRNPCSVRCRWCNKDADISV